jgi:hypothetical protein
MGNEASLRACPLPGTNQHGRSTLTGLTFGQTHHVAEECHILRILTVAES